MPAREQSADVQALVKTGFGSLGGASYLLLRIDDAAAARAWLARIEVASVERVEGERLAAARQLAFTARGLRALGLTDPELDAFVPEFIEGMTAHERRASRLGDVGESAPETWAWGHGDQQPDLLIASFGARAEIREVGEALATEAAAHGLGRIEHLVSALDEGSPELGREPFGFADGISQPELDWDDTVEVKGARNRRYRNCIAAGEFLLGNRNEYGFIAEYPEAGGIGRNGTYLVFRQIEQRVGAFWEAMAAQAGPEGAIRFAERCVGRTIGGGNLFGSGAPNAFTFASDPDGQTCPIGSHIRRANPRTSDDPLGDRGLLNNLIATLGFAGDAQHDAIASARYHRILRRGRSYGPMQSAADVLAHGASHEPAGLYFICLNASLARQFEFVQGAWLASPTFAGLTGEQDPLLGNREEFPTGCPTSAFSYWDEAGEPRLWSPLPRFTKVRGGAYFFLPGLSGLKAILGA